MNTPKNRLLGLLFWLSVCLVTAAVSGFASVHADNYYDHLIKPEWSPPGWLFAPLCSIFYILMGVAAWQIWVLRGWKGAKFALTMFFVQIGLNTMWTWLFFYFQTNSLSFFEILLLWWLILATMAQFWRTKPLAGALLIPSLIWVTFAAKLNLTIWQLNQI